MRLVGCLLGGLPLETAANLSALCWRVFAPLSKRHQRALDNLARAFPEKSAQELRSIADGMWDHLGRMFAEHFRLPTLSLSDRVTYDNPDWALSETGLKQAGIVCAPHLGNWELIVVAALRAGLVPAGLYQEIKNPWVGRFIKKLRLSLYPGGLYPKGEQSLRRLVRHAKKKGTVALLADLREKKGISVQFFGHTAPSTHLPASLAHSLNLRLYVGCAIRENGSHFRLICEEIPVHRSVCKETDILQTTQNIQSAFERYIRAYPEQWMWAHRRWG